MLEKNNFYCKNVSVLNIRKTKRFIYKHNLNKGYNNLNGGYIETIKFP